MFVSGDLTPVSDSSAITPPCSPPCDVIDMDIEEGELKDEEDMSDISEAEPSYDSGRYYRTGSMSKDVPDAVSGGCVFDSPASPEIGHHVSGSPLKIIPKSPMRSLGDTASNDDEEEEDMDEDLLYLRLIALRSLADENKPPEDVGDTDEADKKLANEMKELLEEAEVAANETATDVESAEVITIDDEEDDPISEMKLNLHETYLKFKESVGSPALLELVSPVNSRIQSPSYSPPTSRKDVDVVDLTSPYSPTNSPSSLNLPPLPPLPPPVPYSPLPPLPPSQPPSHAPSKNPSLLFNSLPHPKPTTSPFPEPVPTTNYLSRHGEPLPPGEDEDPSSPTRSGAQDMEIDNSEDAEAESSFFLNQQNDLFPASVWGFSQRPTLIIQPRPSRDENEEGNKRGSIEEDEEDRETSQDDDVDVDDELNEEEASLRSLLLAQVNKNKVNKKQKIEDFDTPVQSPTSIEKNLIEVDVVLKDTNVKTSSNETSKSVNSLEQKKPSGPKFKRLKNGKVNKINATKQKQKMKDKIKRKGKAKQITISEAEQRIYFPNLSKKVVVHISGNDSTEDSEDDDDQNNSVCDNSMNTVVSDNLFGLDLEAFLKQARKSTDTQKQSNTAPAQKVQNSVEMKTKSPPKKLALTPKLKAKASTLTLEDKKRLIDAKITNLSKSKQLEYQRLREILAKKEKEKVLKANQKKEETKVDSNQPVKQSVAPVEKSISITEEEEEELRMKLIQNMKKNVETKGEKPKNPAQSSSEAALSKLDVPVDKLVSSDSPLKKLSKKSQSAPVTPKKNSSKPSKSTKSTPRKVQLSPRKLVETRESPRKVIASSTTSTKSSMSIEIAGDSREVTLNLNNDKEEMQEQEDLKKSVELKALETDVVEMRRGLSASLFKLSAYMSQLQKETSGVDSAIKYIEELKKQLQETEKLVMIREKKVDSLRDVIRESHRQITVQKQEMTQKEEDCRNVGIKIVGDEYKPPVEGAENIRKKLEMIRNTAMKVKTTSFNKDQTGKNEGGGKGGPEGLTPALTGDYRSPLEHLSAGQHGVDHSKEVCRFALVGKCNDDTCQLQHL